MYLRNYFAKIAYRYYYVSFLPKWKSLWIKRRTKKMAIVTNNIEIRIAGKVSRYIDASMNRATPTIYPSRRRDGGAREAWGLHHLLRAQHAHLLLPGALGVQQRRLAQQAGHGGRGGRRPGSPGRRGDRPRRHRHAEAPPPSLRSRRWAAAHGLSHQRHARHVHALVSDRNPRWLTAPQPALAYCTATRVGLLHRNPRWLAAPQPALAYCTATRVGLLHRNSHWLTAPQPALACCTATRAGLLHRNPR